MEKIKKGRVIVLSSVVIIALILVIGGKLYMNNKEKENRANQRLAALTLRKEEPHATKVVFKYEGGSPGLGAGWTVGADVTMDGEIFYMDLGIKGLPVIYLGNSNEDPEGAEYKSKKLKEIHDKKVTDHPLEVVYYDGEREVIK